MESEKTSPQGISRRTFVSGTLAAGAAGALGVPAFAHATYAGGSDAVRIGLVGCGGRGTGAAINALEADAGVKVVAMADVFEERMPASIGLIQEWLAKKERPDGLSVPPERQFGGMDGYRQLMALEDVDYVLLATPCAFRPEHVEAAMAAGKHVFMEKPAGVDPVGIRRILASAEVARQKKLALVGGTQARFSDVYRTFIDRARSGEFGEVFHGIANWNSGGIWKRETPPEWDDTRKHIQNWISYIWLGGDIIEDYTVHNIDVVCWAFDDFPVEALGTGGRVALDADGRGGVYDHFSVEYRFRDGRSMHLSSRMINGAALRVGEQFTFSKGVANTDRWIATFRDYAGEYHMRENNETLKAINPLIQEHRETIDSIRGGNPLVTGDVTAKSTLVAIMGRMAAYSGQAVTWDFLLNESKLDYSRIHPHEFGPQPEEPIPVPGREPLL